MQVMKITILIEIPDNHHHDIQIGDSSRRIGRVHKMVPRGSKRVTYKKFLEFTNSRNFMTIEEMAEKLGSTESAVYGHLKRHETDFEFNNVGDFRRHQGQAF